MCAMCTFSSFFPFTRWGPLSFHLTPQLSVNQNSSCHGLTLTGPHILRPLYSPARGAAGVPLHLVIDTSCPTISCSMHPILTLLLPRLSQLGAKYNLCQSSFIHCLVHIDDLAYCTVMQSMTPLLQRSGKKPTRTTNTSNSYVTGRPRTQNL